MKRGLKGGDTIHLPFLLTQYDQRGDFLTEGEGKESHPSEL